MLSKLLTKQQHTWWGHVRGTPALFTGLLAASPHSQLPATGNIDTCFLGSSPVFIRILRCFPISKFVMLVTNDSDSLKLTSLLQKPPKYPFVVPTSYSCQSFRNEEQVTPLPSSALWNKNVLFFSRDLQFFVSYIISYVSLSFSLALYSSEGWGNMKHAKLCHISSVIFSCLLSTLKLSLCRTSCFNSKKIFPFFPVIHIYLIR